MRVKVGERDTHIAGSSDKACWNSVTMECCTRPKGHKGLHTFVSGDWADYPNTMTGRVGGVLSKVWDSNGVYYTDIHYEEEEEEIFGLEKGRW